MTWAETLHLHLSAVKFNMDAWDFYHVLVNWFIDSMLRLKEKHPAVSKRCIPVKENEVVCDTALKCSKKETIK